MDRIFMTRTEALEFLLKAHQTAVDKIGHPSHKQTPADHAAIEALDRLLLDVRARRVDQFQINASAAQIIVTD
ncbi:hypothetical protein [Burkholderia thailandensis]|uniref:Uncharacterized protein n=2 Tax=Burkholderia thailandensis TaxID=57975 RepID=A0AAW9CWY5_BURTH|nr:hypothetical protein [Burkholderia thailandensis]2MRL_A Chain A, Uncharacterized protein BTH I2711 [Burkholderia thailandensis E264]ABC38190.1 conserved hypothetical protein [Burkholderia thailandensis E264]AHI63721.1 hypothetical protein BTL_2381 [Burkholderia thailandensis H0587]AHI71863.1 hypothetical protein BTQ_1312 [Burkholderia thailandensis 2002721723]AHI77508.1 hypothetical protein BTJ_1140 [Burkholderia thailandensis E444]AIC85718.1 hypothetical protein BTRA_2661 [Burkholderia th